VFVIEIVFAKKGIVGSKFLERAAQRLGLPPLNMPQSVDSLSNMAWCRSIRNLVAPSRRSQALKLCLVSCPIHVTSTVRIENCARSGRRSRLSAKDSVAESMERNRMVVTRRICVEWVSSSIRPCILLPRTGPRCQETLDYFFPGNQGFSRLISKKNSDLKGCKVLRQAVKSWD
jgi:hypothetical protein